MSVWIFLFYFVGVFSKDCSQFYNDYCKQSKTKPAANYTAEEKERIEAAAKKKEPQVQKLFEETKALLENRIRYGRSEGALSLSEKALIRQIKDAMIFFVSADSPRCETLDGAEYKISLNTIFVCPQRLLRPNSSMFIVFAHELAHGLDPCIWKNSLWPAYQTKYNAVGGFHHPDEELYKDLTKEYLPKQVKWSASEKNKKEVTEVYSCPIIAAEAYADKVSADILDVYAQRKDSDLMAGFFDHVRYMCQTQNEDWLYPAAYSRIRTYIQGEKISKKLNCTLPDSPGKSTRGAR